MVDLQYVAHLVVNRFSTQIWIDFNKNSIKVCIYTSGYLYILGGIIVVETVLLQFFGLQLIDVAQLVQVFLVGYFALLRINKVKGALNRGGYICVGLLEWKTRLSPPYRKICGFYNTVMLGNLFVLLSLVIDSVFAGTYQVNKVLFKCA